MESENVCESERSEHSVTSFVPRGPIYLPNMMGNISTVPEFQSSFLNLLQELESHLSMESPSSSLPLDVSIDALKIYTEEELTEMAMNEAFKVMKKAGTYDPSGYFLIEITANLYEIGVETQEDEARKTWEYILTSVLQQKQKAILGRTEAMDLPQFGTKEMQSSRICDIRIRLGVNYLYCHQGDCKHIIVIRDMRLSHPAEDVQSKTAYPIMFRPKHRIQKCSVRKTQRASKVAVDDKWANENPCYFCDVCFELLHSDDGHFPCNFPVYDYVYE